ncbi:MAG TPA: dihydroorotase, partial [Saprospiraceae bacterium]|nr:dihydroorotase [Saprospiraceae bacterium]
MRILIKDTFIINNLSGNTLKKQSILIEDGVITDISNKIDVKADHVIDALNMFTSPGWLDIGTQIGEPGNEHREDIQSVTNAAAAGGYTAIAPFPNTVPVIQSKADVSFLKERSDIKVTLIYPIGALSKDCAGKDMTELYDMHAAGAVGFSDGPKSIQDAGLMKRTLEYVQAFNGLILHQASDSSLSDGGQIHEGEISTSLGMKGIPSLAEELLIERDLSLLEYTGGKLHFANISTARSVELIRKAKKDGLQVTTSVAVMNLGYDDSYLTEFDSNYKVLPPLRSKSDK